jgi:hypothetical protein
MLARSPDCYFTFCKRSSLTKVVYFSRIYHHTSFQDAKISGASDSPTSKVREYAIFLLLIVGNWNLRCCGGLQWHSVRSKFRENLSADSEVGKGYTSSMGTATGDGLDCWGSIPGRGNIFLFATALGSTQSPIQYVSRAFTPGVKGPGREVDHSPPSSAEVKNGGAISPFPHTSSWRSA